MLFKKQRDEKFSTYLCLDVGTEYLKIINFELVNEGIYINEYAKIKQHSSAMKSGTVTSLSRVIETVHSSIDQMQNKNFKGVIMGIAGELIKGVTKDINIQRKNPKKTITSNEIASAIEDVVDEAFQQAQQLVFLHIGDTAGELTNLELINHLIVEAIIDGYRVEEPVGLSGGNIHLKVYFTFAPLLHVNYLKKITNSLGAELLSIVPQPFAVSRAIKGSKESNFSGIIIDIGGGTTDLALIQNGVVVGTHMFSIGGRLFTKRIAENLKLTFNDAEEFKVKYSTDQLSQMRKNEVKESINRDVQVWAYGVSIGLEEFIGTVDGFPDKIYLCGGGSILPDIKDALIQFPWTRDLPFNRSPKVMKLFPTELDSIIDSNQLLKDVDDITPASIARFTYEIHQDEV